MDTFSDEVAISVIVAVASVVLIVVGYALDIVRYSWPLIRLSERVFGEKSRQHIRELAVLGGVMACLAFGLALVPVWIGARIAFVYLVFDLAALVIVAIFFAAVIIPGEIEKKDAPRKMSSSRPYTGPIRVSQEWSPQRPNSINKE